jgi:DNA-binding XRE family transcriptional regulator
LTLQGATTENKSVKDKQLQQKTIDPLVEIMEEINRMPRGKKINLKTRLKFLYRFTRLSQLNDADEEVQELKRTLGEHFRERRELFKLKQEDVGKRMLMTGRTISNIESGKAAISSYPSAILALEFCIVDLAETKEKAEMLNVGAQDISA